MKLTLALIFLLLALAGVVLRKNYYAVPARELKRRAARHDPVATQLYRAVAYGNSLRGLLWLYIGLTSAASLVLLARLLPVWASLLIVGPLLWIVFSLLPATRTTRLGKYLTRLATPPIAWLLNYLHPVLSRGADVVEGHYLAAKHTGLFEREDLLALIKRQKAQPDNRLTVEELEIAKRALSFSDHKVADVLTPRKAIKTVLANDTIGPVLIDELHKSGQDYALVRQSAKGDIVGSLRFDQLNLESRGNVRDIMNPAVYYVHENDSLGQALHAFFVTNQPVFMVVNDFEEYLGIISVETILQQLLGHVPGEDFDQYADLSAVAARHTKTDEETAETPVKTDDEVVE
jgi:CBS domain containing-hemolysin-like protein